MTLSEIKKEIAGLSPQRQDELAAFIVHLKHERDPQYAQEMRRRLEDPDPDHWASLESVEQQLGTDGDSSS